MFQKQFTVNVTKCLNLVCYVMFLFQIKEASKNSYPVKVPVPPTTEEFNNILLGNNDTSESPEAQMQKKKELRRFINLYQKSALNSSTRKRNLQGRCDDIFYPEDAAEDYEECSS